MLRVAVKTNLSAEEVRERAIDFFGPDGYGLSVEERSPTSLFFQGAGDSLELIIEPLETGETSIEMLTREWEYQAKRFIDEALDEAQDEDEEQEE